MSEADHRWTKLRHILRAAAAFTRPLRGERGVHRMLSAVHSHGSFCLDAEDWDAELDVKKARGIHSRHPGGWVSQVVLLLLLVMINANDVLLKAFSQRRARKAGREPYSPSSLMLVVNLASVLLGNAVALHAAPAGARLKALSECWSRGRILNMLLPAGLFVLSSTMKFLSLRILSAGDVVAVDQCALLLCAVLGRLLLGKQYSIAQWLSLAAVTASVYCYDLAKRHSTNEASAVSEAEVDGRLLGLLLMAGSVIFSVFGGLSSEVLLKNSPGTPFYVSKAQLEVGGSVAALLSCLVLEPAFSGRCSLLDQGLFAGWDFWTPLVVVVTFSKSWLAGMVVQVLDNLAFSLAGTTSMLLVYVEQLLLPTTSASHEDFDSGVFAAVVVLAASVASYTALSRKSAVRRNSIPDLKQPLLGQRRVQ